MSEGMTTLVHRLQDRLQNTIEDAETLYENLMKKDLNLAMGERTKEDEQTYLSIIYLKDFITTLKEYDGQYPLRTLYSQL